jgi:hypothetical protein
MSLPLDKIGGLPVDASISLDFFFRKTRITFHATLPTIFKFGDGKGAQAELSLFLDNSGGLSFAGAKVGPLDVYLGPLLLKKLQFRYSAVDDSWSGGAQILIAGALGGLDAAPPPPDKGFGLKHGKFDHAGIGIVFPVAAQPQVFPGLFLTHIDISIGMNPLRFTGSAGLSAAKVIDIDGEVFVAFATPDEPYQFPEDSGDLQPLSGRTIDSFTIAVGGQAAVHVPIFDGRLPFANAYLVYEYPSFFELGAGVKFDISFVHIEGGVHGFVDGSSGKWSFDAGVKACLHGVKIVISFDFICEQVGGVISSKGFGFCTDIPVPTPPFGEPVVPIPAGAGYTWGDSLPSLMIFSCSYDDWIESVPVRGFASFGASSPEQLTLPPGLPSAEIRLTGAGAPPDATIALPDGSTISTKSPPSSQDVVVAQLKDSNQTYIALRHPAGGTWTVTAAPGSAPIMSVEAAQGLPAANVEAHVVATGRTRTLVYSATAAKHRTITFAERGPNVYRVLGTTSAAHGRIAFTPAGLDGGARTIVAQVQDAGRPQRSIVVARYTAPRPAPLRALRGLRVRRHGGTVAVSWRPQAIAVRYAVTLTLSNGTRRMVLVRGTAAHIWVTPRLRGSVAVTAVTADGRRGPVRSVRFRAGHR